VTPTFVPPADRKLSGYAVCASPTLYPGQWIEAKVSALESSSVCLTLSHYGPGDTLLKVSGPSLQLDSGERKELTWGVPEVDGYPIAEVGIEVTGEVLLDSVTWNGVPGTILRRPESGEAWRDAWVNGIDHFQQWGEPFRLIQDRGTGLLIHGCREWDNYEVSAHLTLHLVERAGIALHVQGMTRWVALLLCRDGYVRLVKSRDTEVVLAEAPFAWEFGTEHQFSLRAVGARYIASMDGVLHFDCVDNARPLLEGAAAFVVTEGRIGASEMEIRA
jgi:hypothetical protein